MMLMLNFVVFVGASVDRTGQIMRGRDSSASTARVALGGRDDDRLSRAIDTMDAPVGAVRPVQIDVRDNTSVTRAITTIDDA